MGQREVNRAGLDLVKSFEGCPDGDPSTVNLDAYLDPIDIWTIGWGHVVRSGGRMLRGEADRALARSVYEGGITQPQAEKLLDADLIDTGVDVARLATVDLSDNEFAALTSFAFNLGARNLAQSTLLRLLNSGDRLGAAEQFGRWVLANGQPFPGLVKRRRAERDLFLTPDPADGSTT